MRPLKIITILTIVISFAGYAHGQNNEYDTVFVKKSVGEYKYEIDTLFIQRGASFTQVLAGTTFLPYSDKMISLLGYGLSPVSLDLIGHCNNSDYTTFDEYPKFIEIVRGPSTLTIDVSVVANCCHNFLGEAEVVGSDTLNLLYTSYGGFCGCECCFTLRYIFDTSMESNYEILKYVTINGSETFGIIPDE